MTTEAHATYIPPAARVFEQLACEACKQLYSEYGDAAFSNPEVVRGLADYLAYIAELTAKYLNKGHHELLDNDRG